MDESRQEEGGSYQRYLNHISSEINKLTITSNQIRNKLILQQQEIYDQIQSIFQP